MAIKVLVCSNTKVLILLMVVTENSKTGYRLLRVLRLEVFAKFSVCHI